MSTVDRVRVRRVVFTTQQIDPSHPTLGSAVPMVRALAERVDEVAVLALRHVPGVLPPNCRVHSIAAPTQALRGARFARALARELSPRHTAVIAHMSPIYAVLAAPLCRPLGVPVVLWFTHWRASMTLRAGVAAATAVATAEESSFPLPSRKIHAIGHAIDVDAFTCRPDPGNERLVAVALGRTSPIKHLETIVDGVRIARGTGVPVDLEIHGESSNAAERAYRDRIAASAGDGVLLGPLPRTELDELFRRTDMLVNATIDGSLDKAVLEACAACVPALASSPAFASLLPPELRFASRDARQLADRIEWLVGIDPAARLALGRELRDGVATRHSVATWADRILALAGTT